MTAADRDWIIEGLSDEAVAHAEQAAAAGLPLSVWLTLAIRQRLGPPETPSFPDRGN